MSAVERLAPAKLAALTLFCLLAAHTLTETARDALFLSAQPASRLPWVYGLIAVLTVAAQRAERTLRARDPRFGQLSALVLASAAVTGAFWLLTLWSATWILVALYVWPGIFGALVIVEFWRLMSDRYTTSEAKGVYSAVGAGGAAGAIAGSGLAFALSLTVAPRHLLLAATALLALTGAALVRWRPPAPPQSTVTDSSLAADLRLIRRQPYLRGVFGLLLLTTVLVTLVDYVFKSIADRSVDPDALASFFAAVYLALNLLGLLVQVTLVERLVRRFGISGSPAVLPAALGAASLGVLLQGGLAAAFLLKTVDGALRNSLHRTVTELLYVPMARDVRGRIKGFVDIVGHRGGQLAGSTLILLVLAAGGGPRVLSLAIVTLAAVALAAVVRLRRPYLELFRETLRTEAVDTRLAYPELDVRSVSSLTAALSSEREDEVLAALELLAEQQRQELIPGLVLFHPSSAVARRSLDLFARAGRSDSTWAARHLFDTHPLPEVRAAALRLLLTVLDDVGPLESAVDDASTDVRATALVGLLKRSPLEAAGLRARLDRLVRQGDRRERVAVAKAIAQQPDPRFETPLVRLAETDDIEVRAEAATAMAAMPADQFLPPLRAMLAESALRPAARVALVRIGEPALLFLRASLKDPQVPYAVRLHVPRSISRFPPDVALPALLADLIGEADAAIRFKILRGLGRLRADAPAVPLDQAALDDTIREAVVDALRVVHWTTILERGRAPEDAMETRDLLLDLLRDREAASLEAIFRLLGLRHSEEDFERVYRGLRGDAAARASSSEIIEHVVGPPVRDAVLALAGGEDASIVLRRGHGVYRAAPLTEAEAIVGLLTTSTGSLRVVAGLYAAELGLAEARPPLVRARDGETGAFAAPIAQALRRLDEVRA